MNNAPPPESFPALARLPQNWLMMRLGHMGDVVLTTGVLDYLGRNFHWRFHCLTKPAWAEIFQHHPFVQKVIPFAPEMSFTGLASAYEGWGFLDFNANLRSRMLGALWKGPVARYPKLGLDRRLFLLTKNPKRGQKLLAANVPQRYALAVLPAAPPPGELLPRIFLSREEMEQGKALLGEAAGANPVVALHPFASHPEKAWPVSYWKTLTGLLEKAGLSWVVVGKGDPLFPGGARDLTGKTSVRETCAVLAASVCLVSGDSGPMHLASGVGTPVIGLFGPTTREWGFYPAGPHDRVLETDHPCRPCSLHGKKGCPRGRECLRAITPERVMAEVASLAGHIRDHKA